MILLLSIVLIAIMEIFKLPPSLVFWFIMFLVFMKAVSSKDLKELFNLKSMKNVYEKTGLKDSLISLISVFLLIGYYIYREIGIASFSDVLFLIPFVFILYRFLLWNIEPYLRRLYKREASLW